jgi:hypothetical protein
MEDTSLQTTAEVKLVFSRCDICEKQYYEDETKLRNSTNEYSDVEHQELLLLLCNSCRLELGLLPMFNP